MNKERRYKLRQMRKSPTEIERALWFLLRSRQLKKFKFRRQHPIGHCIVDFCCLQKRLVVEIDGQHHSTQKEEDKKRSNFLSEQGFTVIRFWNSEIKKQPEVVLDRIEKTLGSIQRRLTGRYKTYQWKNPLPMEGEGARQTSGGRVRVIK